MDSQILEFINHRYAEGWLAPMLVAVLSLLVGWILDRVVVARLQRWASTTSWRGDDVVLAAVKGLTRIWALLVGVAMASHLAPISDHQRDLAQRLVQALWVLTATLAAARIATGMFAVWCERVPQIGSTTILRNVIAAAVWALGGLVMLQSLGISIAPVLTAMGVGGLAAALALQDTLANVFSGIRIIMARQVRPGDFVRLDSGQEGTIADIGWLNTSVRTLADDLVLVPNSKLSAAVVVNCTLPVVTHTLLVPCSVAYGSDLDRVERVAAEVAAEVIAATEGGLPERPPVARFSEFQDSGIGFNTVMWVKDYPARFLVRHHFIKALHARFAREGIEIPYPTRTVLMKGGNGG